MKKVSLWIDAVAWLAVATVVTMTLAYFIENPTEPARSRDEDTKWSTKTYGAHKYVCTITEDGTMYSNPDFEFLHHPDCSCQKPKPQPKSNWPGIEKELNRQQRELDSIDLYQDSSS